MIRLPGRVREKPAEALLFLVLVGLVLCVQGLYVLNLVRWPAAPDRGFIMHFDLGPHVVAQPRPLGSEAGLQAGDRILSVNGQEYATYREYLGLLDWTPGASNRYTIQRGDAEVAVVVPVRPLGWGIVLQHHLPTLVLGLIFLGLGSLVFVMKPFTRVSWAFLCMTGTLGLLLPYTRSPFLYEPAWLDEAFRVSAFLFGAAMVHLAALFPEDRTARVRHPAVLLAPYAVAIGLAVYSISRSDWHDVVNLILVVPVAGLALFLASAVLTRFRSRSAAARLQALVVMTGVIVAFAVPLTEFSYTVVFGEKLFPDVMYSWLPLVFAFPVSIAYAIVKHDLFEIDAMVRRTYGYLVSAAIVVFAYYATVATLDVVVDSSEFTSSPAFTLFFIIAEIVVIQPLHERAQHLVDRIFYRRRTDYHVTVAAVADRLGTIVEPERVRETLVHVVVDEFALEGGAIYVPAGERFVRAECSGQRPDGPVPACLVAWLRREGAPVFRHDAELAEQSGQAELRLAFDALDAELALPMKRRGELNGILVFGRRKSGTIFTREDLDLLRTVAASGAAALENAQLLDELAISLKRLELREAVQAEHGEGGSAEGREELPLGSSRREGTVLVADVASHTWLRAGLGSREIQGLLQRYYRTALGEVLERGGGVDETPGECVVAFFTGETHARAAVDAALAVEDRANELLRVRRRADVGALDVEVRLGLHSGILQIDTTRVESAGAARKRHVLSGPIPELAQRIAGMGSGVCLSSETAERLGSTHALREIARIDGGEAGELEVWSLAPAAARAPSREEESPGAADSERFVVRGRLRERETSRPLPGLRVRAFDQDLLSEDDFLGEAVTDASGEFEVRYGRADFGSAWERLPDVFLRVFTPDGSTELAETRASVVKEAGKVLRIDLDVPRHRLL